MESIEERVAFLIKDFFVGLEGHEPFQIQLMEFRLRLRAKLLEVITSYPTNPDLANRTLDYALEALEKVLKEELRRVNLESETHLSRTIETLKVVGEVLREFMQENRVRDKRKLSSTAGLVGNAIERLSKEYRSRFGGFLRRIKKLLGIGG